MHLKHYLTLFSFLVTTCAFSQKKQQLSVDLNRSFTGSGDIGGLGFTVEYGNYIFKKMEITGGLSTDIHSDEYRLLLMRGGTTTDASYRMVTAGLQLNSQVNYTPLRTKKK